MTQQDYSQTEEVEDSKAFFSTNQQYNYSEEESIGNNSKMFEENTTINSEGNLGKNILSRIVNWMKNRKKQESNGPKLYKMRWFLLLIYGLTMLSAVLCQSTFSSVRYV